MITEISVHSVSSILTEEVDYGSFKTVEISIMQGDIQVIMLRLFTVNKETQITKETP